MPNDPKVKNAKEKKPKKEKLPKKPKSAQKTRGKAGGAPAPEGEGGKKKGKLNPLVLLIGGAVVIAAALLVIFVILPRLGGEEPDPEPSDTAVYYDLPESFAVGEQTVPGLTPLEAANVQAIRDVRVVYTYIDLTDAGAEAKAYASALRKEGFSVVDDEFVRTDAPEYDTPSGRVLLARDIERPADAAGADGTAGGGGAAEPTPSPSSEPASTPTPAPAPEPTSAPEDGWVDMVLTVELTWSPGQCVVAGDQAEGRVTSPPPSERPSVGGSAMSMREAAEFISSLSPSVLGLSGESMESYRVYAMDGIVMVNGEPCLRLSVYSRDSVGQGNDFSGTYLLNRSGTRLYVLDEQDNEVKELPLP